MTITQTIEITDDRLITLNVPREIPKGPTIITFTPAPAPQWNNETIASAEEARAMIKNKKTSKHFKNQSELKQTLKEILDD